MPAYVITVIRPWGCDYTCTCAWCGAPVQPCECPRDHNCTGWTHPAGPHGYAGPWHYSPGPGDLRPRNTPAPPPVLCDCCTPAQPTSRCTCRQPHCTGWTHPGTTPDAPRRHHDHTPPPGALCCPDCPHDPDPEEPCR